MIVSLARRTKFMKPGALSVVVAGGAGRSTEVSRRTSELGLEVSITQEVDGCSPDLDRFLKFEVSW